MEMKAGEFYAEILDSTKKYEVYTNIIPQKKCGYCFEIIEIGELITTNQGKKKNYLIHIRCYNNAFKKKIEDLRKKIKMIEEQQEKFLKKAGKHLLLEELQG